MRQTIAERWARLEVLLINRALRRRKSWLDRLVTRLVMRRVPTVPAELRAGLHSRGRLDAPRRLPHDPPP